MMQCKDILTLPILVFIERYGGIGCNWFEYNPELEARSNHWRSVRQVMPPNLPENLIHAKMRMLIKKGYIDGCPCGCRGDFELTERGKQVLELARELLPIAAEKFAQAEFDRQFKGEGDPDKVPVGILGKESGE